MQLTVNDKEGDLEPEVSRTDLILQPCMFSLVSWTTPFAHCTLHIWFNPSPINGPSSNQLKSVKVNTRN